jgi:hypothetical protein
MLTHERHELRGVVALAHDLEAGALEQTRQAFAEKNVVVRQDDACAAVAHNGDCGDVDGMGVSARFRSA